MEQGGEVVVKVFHGDGVGRGRKEMSGVEDVSKVDAIASRFRETAHARQAARASRFRGPATDTPDGVLVGEVYKHEVSMFCGIYSHVLGLNKSMTSALDALRRARDLYR
jgi:hypothetical protein